MPSLGYQPCLLLMLLAVPMCGADEVLLDSGGRVLGDISQQATDRREVLRVDLPGGGRVLLRRTKVAKATDWSPEFQEYRQRAASAPDTAQTHYQIALWCRDRKLTEPFQAHLQRVLELDPNHSEARKLLGYRLQNGQWMNRDQRMTARGMIRHEGDFRTAQEIELIERKKRSELAAAKWRKQLARWRRDLSSNDPQEVQTALHSFQQLTAPQAAGALVKLLSDERDPDVQELLIKTASQIEHPATVQALAKLSLNDPRYEIRQYCLDQLIRAERPGLADIYVKSLNSKDNATINRAADALQAVADPNTASALVDALITQHTIKLGADRPKDTYTMDSQGGFTFGGGKGKSRKVTAKNPSVLSALVEITGQNFEFDQQAWRRWLDTRVEQETVDLRRDE